MKNTDYTPWYLALKQHNLDAYNKCIDYASGIVLSRDLDDDFGHEIEAAMVVLACELLDIEP